ncbi:ArsR/SmtB family transcription factor [Limnochorda pilosa]|uniref:ArsR family transcriptional regulator n=1 Tax=Limnochorda pilosa TaxID=1555112 RepID=A0A0K2SQD0_LIMPI|nr:metalloregulator ArsR/SmtB family transcription factor [Limnochorda pilosa]BAS29197.1 ArsR family transcriptional regulator [Limnochorda pilosa]
MARAGTSRTFTDTSEDARLAHAKQAPPSTETPPKPAHDLCEVEGFHPEAIARALSDLPDPNEAQRVADLFALLADPSRVRILHALAREELCVCDVAAVTGLSVSAVSHQLRLLRRAGAVAYRKEGRMAYYRLVDTRLAQLLQEVVQDAR